MVCECANDHCAERVSMSSAEYETIRRDGKRFFVAPGEAHVLPEVERVVARNDRYWIVEKIGTAGKLAEHTDPRSPEP
jgi:hypothetical protein